MTAALIVASVLIGWAALLGGIVTAVELSLRFTFPVFDWVSDQRTAVALLLIVPAGILFVIPLLIGTGIMFGGGALAVVVWP